MGAGGVGGYLGGVLAKSGQEVTFVARGGHLKAIQTRGLSVESKASGDLIARAPAIERPDGTWTADLALFCVKSYHNQKAMATMAPAVGEDTVVLTLQNGVGSGDELSDAFGGERVMLGVVYIDAMRKGPGLVAHVGDACRIVFGEKSGLETARATKVRDAFMHAGIDVELSSDIEKELWNKLLFICALSGMTCIARAPFADVLDTPQTLDLTWKVMREVTEVAAARRIDLDDDIVESTMAGFQRSKHRLISSMQLDLESGKPLELSAINGAISRIGREVGVATPVNDFITSCLTLADSRARAQSESG